MELAKSESTDETLSHSTSNDSQEDSTLLEGPQKIAISPLELVTTVASTDVPTLDSASKLQEESTMLERSSNCTTSLLEHVTRATTDAPVAVPV